MSAATNPYNVLSPTSLEFMNVLEKQLAAEESQRLKNGYNGSYYPVQQSINKTLQGNNVNTNGSDIPLTPELLDAFAQELLAAGFSKAEIERFKSGQRDSLNISTNSYSNGPDFIPTSAAAFTNKPDNYPQPGVHTPEASSSGKSRNGATESNASSPVNLIGNGVHMDSKRKAEEEELEGHLNARRHLEDDDSSTDEPDSRNKKGNLKKNSSRRKSTNGSSAAMSHAGGPPEEDAQAKALKRKNQNRAAQKAFRERREQRVKDLEDKVAELEASNAGRTFENENLKQLLSKLQKENLALKESKFTFNVPFPGVTPGNLNQANESSASTSKPSSPPLSTVNRGSEEPGPASLRKFKEMSPASTSGISNNLNCPSNDSPNSAFDASSDGASPLTRRDTSTSSTGGVEHVFNPEPYNAFVSPGGITQYTPFAAAAENIVGGVDLQAMLNVFKAQYGQRPAAQPTPAGQSLSGFSEYREPSADPLISYSGMGGDGPGQDLSGVEGDLFGDDEAMNEFLRSLSQPDDAGNGAYNVEDILNDPAWPSLNNVNNSNNNVSSSVSPDQAREDPYSSQLRPNPPYSRESTGATSNGDQSISGASASIDPTFSPSNYFTMSPEPGLPGSGSGQGVGIMSTMAPFSSANFDRTDVNLNNVNIDGICPLTNFQAQTEGMKPEQIWTAFKDQIETGQLDISNGFDLDDLCDNFKAKAKCSGLGPVISANDVHQLIDTYKDQTTNPFL